MIQLLPILATIEENAAFAGIDDCVAALRPSVDYYRTIGYNPPWICYFAKQGDELVGSAGYKGQPVDNKIEIAYGTFPRFENKGIGTKICNALVLMALQENPDLIVTARTLPMQSGSTRILEKNNFKCFGAIWDKDDGEVWEWVLDH